MPRTILSLVVAGTLLGAAGCGREVHLGAIGDGASSLLWSATFEPGNLSEWTGDGQGGTDAENVGVAPRVTAAVAHEGHYAGVATVLPWQGLDSINYFFRNDPSPPEAYYGVWINIAPGFSVGTWLSVVHFRGSSSGDGTNTFPTWDLNLYPQADGSLTAQLYNYSTTVNLRQLNPLTVPTGRWVHFEIFLKKAADTTGEFRVWQDDVDIFDVTDVITAPTTWMQWSVGAASNDITPTPGLVYIDDATISVARLGDRE